MVDVRRSVLSYRKGLGYESFDLSKTHSLSTQDLVKFFIHSFIRITTRESFLKQKTALKKTRKLAIK